MWETMGPIADRTHDRLGASDLAIVEFRRIMVAAAQAFRDQGSALGASGNWSHLRSFEGVVPKSVEWRALGDAAAPATATVAAD